MSADDGARLLWLDFGGEDGEIVSVTRGGNFVYHSKERMNPSFRNNIPSSSISIVGETRDECNLIDSKEISRLLEHYC